MKRIYHLLFLCYCIAPIFAKAQPSTTPSCAVLELSDAKLGEQQDFCLQLTSDQLSDIVGIQTFIEFDTTAFTYTGVTFFPALPDATDKLFSTPEVANQKGEIGFTWISSNLSGVNLASQQALFELCFSKKNTADTLEIIRLDPERTELISEETVGLLDLTLIHGSVLSGSNAHIPQITGSCLKAGACNSNSSSIEVAVDSNLNSPLLYSYEWLAPNQQVINSLTPDKLTNGIYHLNIYNWPDARKSASFILGAGIDGAFSLTLETSCEQGIELLARTDNPDAGPYFFSWSTGYSESGSNSTLQLGSPQTVSLTVTNAMGCTEVVDDFVIVCDDPAAGRDTLQLFLPEFYAEPGELRCQPLTVRGFNEVSGFQFGLQADSSLLHLQRLDSPFSSNFTQSNYSFTASGALRVSWFDQNIQGLTLIDDALLFNLCFQAGLEEGDGFISHRVERIAPEFYDNQLKALYYDSSRQFPFHIQRFVRPGDTNLDGRVSPADLLPLGLAFGQQGPVRPDASITFVRQAAPNWPQVTASSALNYRFIDTDGNGQINTLDTLAIRQNMGSTYEWALSPARESEIRSNGTPLFIVADSIYAGETFSLPIHLGNSEEPAENVYGLSFTLQYDPEVIITNKPLSLSFDNCWLGTRNEDMLAVYEHHPEDGTVEVALTRTDQQDRSGYGPLLAANITIEDVIFTVRGDDPVFFRIENVRLLNSSENILPVATPPSSSKFSGTTTNSQELLNPQALQVFPQPAREEVFLQLSGLELIDVRLYDAQGRQVLQTRDDRIQTGQFTAGLYQLRVQTNEGLIIQPLIIQ